jgi:hypothetical protein
MVHSSVVDFVQRILNAEHVTGRRVLEVGSHHVNGSLRPYVESLAPAEYLEVDTVSGPSVDRIADYEQLCSYVGNGWDIVISTEMLEHALDWRACMLELADALAVGGPLIITTRSPGFPYHLSPDDYWRYTPAVMQRILDALRLDTVLIEDDPQAPGVFAVARKHGGTPSQWALWSLLRNICAQQAPRR